MKNEWILFMDNISVSVIVPIHGFGDYVYRCMDSLREQTLQNIEIIIVDDASEEDIKGLLSNYLESEHFHYIRSDKRVGAGGARNIGLKNTSGEYVGFCDCDDWVDLDYYEKMYQRMMITDADIAMSGQIREYDEPVKNQIYKCRYEHEIALSGHMAFQIMTYSYNVGVQVIPSCTNKLYRKDFLTELDAQFQENVYFQDTILSFQVIPYAKKIICVPSTLYHHYRRKGSVIQSFDYKHIDDLENFGRTIRNILEADGAFEKYKKNYYQTVSHFYGIVIREIFSFVHDETERKHAISKTFQTLKNIIVLEEYIDCISSEQLRHHLIPEMDDTTLY